MSVLDHFVKLALKGLMLYSIAQQSETAARTFKKVFFKILQNSRETPPPESLFCKVNG